VATKKQVRRRRKERRHEWEEVYVDDEGNVVDPPDEAEADARPTAKRDSARKPTRSTGRTIQPPSWRRVLKRGLLFAPLMFVTVLLLSPDDATTAQQVSQTVFLLLIFLPFSYAMDVMTYRMWRKRTGQADADGKGS
jgi:hypothetical protein